MTEEGAEPRGGRGAEVVDDKAELGADRGREVGAEWRRKVVGRKAGSEAMSTSRNYYSAPHNHTESMKAVVGECWGVIWVN